MRNIFHYFNIQQIIKWHILHNYVEINNVHVSIIMLHVDIVHLACMEQIFYQCIEYQYVTDEELTLSPHS